ncbi:hypothetical protein DFJ58DRAFT_752346 [Suillus subalutaceus]|uniref:uncharacterized protein n=1 Tax=Suillus subalutaceus TaxID=48586 RepID=UPI001B87ACFF|nr:uncharacterized protein DFJ58DRAFT_752346 [Suillus subalutaceus]KAG1877701.1 hypothetical protein DFJ58DRAFT_752346 [Suillus subalutaceus]
MLLKFSKSDILNSALVYPETGALGYTILTRSHFIRDSGKDSDTESEEENGETRRTTIYNKLGEVIAEIGWKGKQPIEIVISREKIIGAKGMFGCSSAILSRNVLGIPTRFDTEYFWMAAPDALTLLDYDSNQTKGSFHTNSMRVGERFIAAPIPGLGHDYLEFEMHPLASTEELLVSFILMEVLRRSRFNLHTDSSDRSKLWRSTPLANWGRRLRRRSI